MSDQKRILICDDDAVSVLCLSRFLQEQGYAVLKAQDGPTAVSLATTQKPDLILLDLGLPSPNPAACASFDGFKVLDWLRRMLKDRKVPVIVLSMMDPAEAQDPSLAGGAVAYLQKPADGKVLLDTIQTALAAS
jgi:CheY-like chemotaxis protein